MGKRIIRGIFFSFLLLSVTYGWATPTRFENCLREFKEVNDSLVKNLILAEEVGRYNNSKFNEVVSDWIASKKEVERKKAELISEIRRNPSETLPAMEKFLQTRAGKGSRNLFSDLIDLNKNCLVTKNVMSYPVNKGVSVRNPVNSTTAISPGAISSTSGSGEVISNSIGMKLKLIPAGSFLMGSSAGQDNERPVRKVTISKPFYLGVHEVTSEQYCSLTGERSFFPFRPNQPIYFISWAKAKNFCKKLSEKEGVQYRLPTEAEWEYACRAGTTTEYYWGNEPPDAFEWYHYNSALLNKKGVSTRTTHDVGTRKPNPWGIHDMCGNVPEWCEDYYSNSYSAVDLIDPKGPSSGLGRVVRGGDYSNMGVGLRSTARNVQGENIDPMSPGFRVVRNL